MTYRQASPPLNVTAVAGQAGEVVVSWDAASDDGGSPITYYQAQWSRTGTGGWSNACRSNSGYYLEYSEDGGLYGWERLTWLWTDQTKVLDSTVEPGATRYYRVAGYKEENRGSPARPTGGSVPTWKPASRRIPNTTTGWRR